MIKAVNNLNLLPGKQDIGKDKESAGLSFADFFKDSLNQVNNLMLEADQIAEDFTLGKIDNVHQVTIATEKAQVALNLTLTVQNKVVEAYKEIMRLQV